MIPTMRDTLTFLGLRKQNYQSMFGANSRVFENEALKDLARFCRAFDNAAVPGDHDRTWAQIGRREVWLRIQQHLNLQPDELAALYRAVAVDQGER